MPKHKRIWVWEYQSPLGGEKYRQWAENKISDSDIYETEYVLATDYDAVKADADRLAEALEEAVDQMRNAPAALAAYREGRGDD